MVKRFIACWLLVTLVAACSPVDFLNHTIPSNGYQVTRDVAYGDHARQKLDIYVPIRASTDNKRPVVLFFYGGSWQFGSKDDYLFLGQALSSRGFVTVIADYRLYPEVYFPAFVEDGAKALRYVHDSIGTYHGDADKLFVAGHSAGAFIAAMLAVNDTYLTNAGAEPAWIKGMLGIAGPYDFLPFLDDDIKAIFSKVKPEDSQPVTFVKEGRPPMLLATGDEDTTVIPRNTYRFADTLRRYHNSVETHVYHDVGHIGIMLSLARGFRTKTPLLDDMDRFIAKHSKN